MRDIHHSLKDEYGGYSCFNDEVHHNAYEEDKIDLGTWSLIIFLILGLAGTILVANHMGFTNLITF